MSDRNQNETEGTMRTRELKVSDIRRGAKIIDRERPEVGVWIVQDQYDEGIWEIRSFEANGSRRGDTTLMEGNARFYDLVL